MADPCQKEPIIQQLVENHKKTDIALAEVTKSQIRIETLLDSLIKYQITENAKNLDTYKIESTRVQVDLEKRVSGLETLKYKVVAWASVGSIIGGFLFSLVSRFIFKY